MKVIIVGAGPTGLTAAVELARQGVVPTVIDKRTEPSGFSRAVGITPSSLKLLSPSGVTDQLLEAGPVLKGICAYFDRQQLLSLDFSEHRSRFDPYDYKTPLHCLPQDKTESILTRQFASMGGKIQFGVECLDLKQNEDLVTLCTTKGKSDYDYVIGADGIRSTIRQKLGIPFTGHELPEVWSIADVDTIGWQHPLEFCAFSKSNGDVCVAAPIGEQRIRLVSNTNDSLATLPIDINVRQVRRQASFTISIRQADRFSQGRVFLAGDAAHCHSPVGGRGMNLGIADAAQLADCIINNTTASYHRLRYPEATKTIRMTERGRTLLTRHGRISNFLKPAVMRMINRSSFIKQRMIESVLKE